MEENEFLGVKISVDCCDNDPVDIRCGGPDYLGYDFFVRAEDKEEMIEFIKEKIEEFGLPLQAIYAWGERVYPINILWTKGKIIDEIPKYKNIILSESKGRSR
jgi:hypothetical protein